MLSIEKSKIELPGILLKPRKEIYDSILNHVISKFGVDVVLTGIKDESIPQSYFKTSTYGVTIFEMNQFEDSNDLLDYALNTIAVYNSMNLSKTENGDYKVSNPQNAVLGFLHLGWV